MSLLEEIEARLAAATPGPWEWVPSTVEGGSHVLGGAGEQGFPVLRTASAAYALPRDAALIAHAPSDLTALVAVVKAVRAARRDLDHHHAHMVPGRWDNDGSHCDVCARVGAMDDALRTLEAK